MVDANLPVDVLEPPDHAHVHVPVLSDRGWRALAVLRSGDGGHDLLQGNPVRAEQEAHLVVPIDEALEALVRYLHPPTTSLSVRTEGLSNGGVLPNARGHGFMLREWGL